MRSPLLPVALAGSLLVAAVGVACATAPAARSPLRERLANADTPAVEDATRACLSSGGYKVDPVGSVSGGSNVVSAKAKTGEPVQVFVHPPDQRPRVTGGPDDDTFWACLSDKLAGAGGGADTGDGGDDKGDGGKS